MNRKRSRLAKSSVKVIESMWRALEAKYGLAREDLRDVPISEFKLAVARMYGESNGKTGDRNSSLLVREIVDLGMGEEIDAAHAFWLIVAVYDERKKNRAKATEATAITGTTDRKEVLAAIAALTEEAQAGDQVSARDAALIVLLGYGLPRQAVLGLLREDIRPTYDRFTVTDQRTAYTARITVPAHRSIIERWIRMRGAIMGGNDHGPILNKSRKGHSKFGRHVMPRDFMTSGKAIYYVFKRLNERGIVIGSPEAIRGVLKGMRG